MNINDFIGRMTNNKAGIRRKVLIPVFSLALALTGSTASMVLFSGCSSGGGAFEIKGHILNMNQGQLLIYSPDGSFLGIDTIPIRGGRFKHEIPCEVSGLLMLVFPNFTEVPIFTKPGGSANINGNASNLKELKIEGEDANELMTKFRLQIAQLSPDETRQHAIKFIEENAKSPVSIYLLRRYLLFSEKSNYEEVGKLLEKVRQAQRDSVPALHRLTADFEMLKAKSVGQKVPRFSGKDLKGLPVTDANLGGSLSVIYTWASWNYDSQNMQRRLRHLSQQSGSRLNLVGICLDASRTDCERTMKNDSISTPVIFDGRMFETPAMRKLGLSRVPDNIIVSREGRIIACGLSLDQLEKRLKELLKL